MNNVINFVHPKNTFLIQQYALMHIKSRASPIQNGMYESIIEASTQNK